MPEDGGWAHGVQIGPIGYHREVGHRLPSVGWQAVAELGVFVCDADLGQLEDFLHVVVAKNTVVLAVGLEAAKSGYRESVRWPAFGGKRPRAHPFLLQGEVGDAP